MTAALLLAANEHASRLHLPHPTVDEILSATDATRSRAYELRATLIALLPTLQRPAGRPRAQAPEPGIEEHQVIAAVTGSVLRFVMAHPGCVRAVEGHRANYSDVFRQCLVELREKHLNLPLSRFSQAVHVPLDTLEDWLRVERDPAPETLPQDDASEPRDARTPMTSQIETVLAEWKKWAGTFGDFCVHLEEHCRIPFKRTLIGNILSSHGARRPAKREGRSPDECALRKAFETFFPNAQWVADGSAIAIEVNHVVYVFNFELMVDPRSGAFVGAALTDEEDSAAVIDAFRDARQTTGDDPLALLLDNRPSNHTAEVDAELGDTLRMRATPFRPQNKAHCEGAFGLFRQTVPPLVVNAGSPRGLAHAILALVLITFARAVNHRPRRDRDGNSRVELHGEKPTHEEIEHARAALTERCRIHRLAQTTIEARQRPEVRALLDRTFERLALLDPERNVRIAIAVYPLDAIVEGIAIFDGKRVAGTLPPGVDARYLLGIVRNDVAQREGMAIFEALLRGRMEMRDILLGGLQVERAAVASDIGPTTTHLKAFVDRACDAKGKLDRCFWLITIVDTIREQPSESHETLLRTVAQRINATFRITPPERLDAVRFIVGRVLPLS